MNRLPEPIFRALFLGRYQTPLESYFDVFNVSRLRFILTMAVLWSFITVSIAGPKSRMTFSNSETFAFNPLICQIDSSIDVSCNSGNDGEIFSSATGGVTPYTFSIGAGITNSTGNFQGLAAGTYSITITDAIGTISNCGAITLSEPAPLLTTCISNHSNDILDCNGDMDGGVIVVANGGTTDYTYLWSTGATTIAITGLPAGDYSVTVTDAQGCASICMKTISEPTPVTECVTNLANDSLDCFGDMDGEMTVNVSGGTPAYFYVWNTGSTTTAITGLGAGNYSVTVTDSKGCKTNCSKTITQPAPLLVSCSSNHPNDRLDCNGDLDGSISVSASGGVADYSYLWSTGASTMMISGLGAGTYSVSVIDDNGCFAVCTRTLTEPTELDAQCFSNLTNDQLDCNGDMTGTIEVQPLNGTPGYSYLWSTGDSTISINGLGVGSYSVTVTDSAGCVVTCERSLTEPPPLTANCTSDLVNDSLECFGDLLGAVNVVPGGGNGGYTFVWSTGSTNQTTTGLGAGLYDVTVTDFKGCQEFCSKELFQPAPIVVDCTTNHPNDQLDCFGDTDGAISSTAVGGIPDYTFLWSTGETAETTTGLAAGLYTVVVTDDNGCTSSCSRLITQPAPIQSLAVSNHPNDRLDCHGDTDGSITVIAFDGTPGYSYLWETGETSLTITGLGAGAYDVTITDANGCQSVTTKTLTEPPPVTALTSTNHQLDRLDCNGDMDGAVTVLAGGGTPGYSFAWNTGSITDMVSGVGAGLYGVTVTDSKGCSESSEKTLTEPELLQCLITNIIPETAIDSNNGAFEITISGGTPDYSFVVKNSNDATVASGSESVDGGTQSISGLDGDELTIDITDSKGCMTTCFVDLRNVNYIIEKRILSLPTSTGEANEFEMDYEIVVSNIGTIDTLYDLSDTFKFGEASLLDLATVSYQLIGENDQSGLVNPNFDGLSNFVIVRDERLVSGESERWKVHLVFELDITELTSDNRDCLLAMDESGTGLFNVATIDGGVPKMSDTACIQPPDPRATIDKLVINEPISTGTLFEYTVSYLITVTNTADAPAFYDLSDTFKYGTGALINDVTIAYVGGEGLAQEINPDFDGKTDYLIVEEETLAVGQQDIYSVTTVFQIFQNMITPQSANCLLESSELGTGLLNAATVDGSVPRVTDIACAPMPRGCLDTFIYIGPDMINDSIAAAELIETKGPVVVSALTFFNSPNISLGGGFEVLLGAEFSTLLDGCINDSFNEPGTSRNIKSVHSTHQINSSNQNLSNYKSSRNGPD